MSTVAPNLFINDTMKEIEASEEALNKLFGLVKTGTAMTAEKLKMKYDKDVLAKEVIKLVSRLQKNVETMKRACSEVELSRNEAHNAEKIVTAVQAELIDCNRNQIGRMQTALEEKLETGMRSYSEVIKRKLDQPPNVTLRSIKTAVKDVMDQREHEPDRSKNVIVYGLAETIDDSLEETTGRIFEELNLKPKLEAVVRLGKASVGKSRPVKVSLSSVTAVNDVLRSSKNLKQSRDYSSIYVSPDMSPEQREKRKTLVLELKKKIVEEPTKKWYIRSEKVMCDEGPDTAPRKCDTSSSEEESVSRSKQEEKKTPMKVTLTKRGGCRGGRGARGGRAPIAVFSDFTDITSDTD